LSLKLRKTTKMDDQKGYSGHDPNSDHGHDDKGHHGHDHDIPTPRSSCNGQSENVIKSKQ